MRRKKMALALLATASLVLVTACGAKKNSDTTAASESSTAESMTTSEGASTVAGESTDPGDENVVYDTYSPEELSSIEQSEADEEAKEEAEEDAKEETGAHESAKADDGPTGKVTKIKKNKAGNYVKPESTSKAVEPPLSATMPEESESAH